MWVKKRSRASQIATRGKDHALTKQNKPCETTRQGRSGIGTTFRRISKCARLIRRAHVRCACIESYRPGAWQFCAALPGTEGCCSWSQW